MNKLAAWLLAMKALTIEAFNKMEDAEAQAGIFLEFNEHLEKEHSEALEAAKGSDEQLVTLKAEFATYREEVMKAEVKMMNANLKAFGVQIKELKKSGNRTSNKSFTEQIRESLEANKEALAGLKDRNQSKAKNSGFGFVVKVAGTITSANVSGGNVPVEDRIEGLDIIPSRKLRFLDMLSQRSTSSNLVSWVSQANKDGAAGVTGEGATKNQIDYDLVVSSEALKKVTAFIKVSTEMMDDIPWIMSEIREELMRELLKSVEDQVYEGDGTGNNLNGIRTIATAFAAGTHAGEVDNANEVDVLRAAMDQIEVAEHDEPTAIFMHPSDLTSLKFVKVDSTDKRYVDALNEIASAKSLDGVPIVKTTLVTQGEYLVGNFNLAKLVTASEGVRIDIGLDGDDFTKNLRTILAEWRGLSMVKTNERTAFVAGTFATDKAVLETT
jgi:HK97 family phage major capsid protein